MDLLERIIGDALIIGLAIAFFWYVIRPIGQVLTGAAAWLVLANQRQRLEHDHAKVVAEDRIKAERAQLAAIVNAPEGVRLQLAQDGARIMHARQILQAWGEQRRIGGWSARVDLSEFVLHMSPYLRR